MSISIALHTVTEIEVVNFEANEARQAFAVVTFKDGMGNDTTAYIDSPDQLYQLSAELEKAADKLHGDQSNAYL